MCYMCESCCWILWTVEMWDGDPETRYTQAIPLSVIELQKAKPRPRGTVDGDS